VTGKETSAEQKREVYKVVLVINLGMLMVLGSWFADGLNLVICNTKFRKQESKLVTYMAGAVKSRVDYIIIIIIIIIILFAQ